jgi:hypothetical protein
MSTTEEALDRLRAAIKERHEAYKDSSWAAGRLRTAEVRVKAANEEFQAARKAIEVALDEEEAE